MCNIITNSSDGVRFFSFDDSNGLQILRKETECAAKALVFSADGSKLAFSDGEAVSVRDTQTNEQVASVSRKNISKLVLSPHGCVLVTYESYRKTAEFPDGFPNLFFHNLATGSVLNSRIHIPAETWRPQWSSDGNLCAQFWQGQIQFYVDNRFDEKPKNTLAVRGVRHFSLSKSSINRNLAVYIPEEKGKPSMVCVYAWRNGECVQLANKSFFRADSVGLHWSDSGTSLLVLATTKTSDTSYYGEQMLHFVTTSQAGDSASVPMPRKGPIHQVLWRPNRPNDRPSDERFLVCQGTIPSVVAVFNIKCEMICSLGSGSWNQLYFNPHGNLLLAGGFGSLNGAVTVWDFSTRTKLSEFCSQNTTFLTWVPDGEHLIAAITTPRLRVNNGFTLLHYNGDIIAHESVEKRAQPRAATVDLPAATEHELFQVLIQPVPIECLKSAPIPKKANLSSTQAGSSHVTVDKPKAYVPPALRNRSATAAHSAAVASSRAKANLKGFDNFVYSPRQSGPVGGISFITSDDDRTIKQKSSKVSSNPSHAGSSKISGDSDTRKQINYINKKLAEIEKLKIIQKNSSSLEKSQLEKIAKEDGLRKQLSQLKL